MARRIGWIGALLLLVLLVLSGLGGLGALGVPAWLTPVPEEGESIEVPTATRDDADAAARGPRLEGQPAPPVGPTVGEAATRVTGPRITGRCVTEAGAGIAGARLISIPDTNVKLFTLDELGREGCPASEATSDADGRFVVPVSKDAPYHIVLAMASGFGSTGRGNLAIGADVTLTLAPSKVMTGRVRNTRGEPVAGARVRALVLIDTLQHTVEALSGADGTYRLEGLPAPPSSKAGDWAGYMLPGWIEVTAASYAPLLVDVMRTGGLWKEQQDWTLASGAVLVGRVEDAETGAPIPQASFAVHSIEGMQGYVRSAGNVSYSNPWSPRLLARGSAGADGTFQVEHLPCKGVHGSASNNALPGGKQALGGVTAWAPGYGAQGASLEVAADGARLEVTLSLHPAAVLRGRIVEEGGAPIAGVRVSAAVEGRPSAVYIPPVLEVPSTSWAISDAEGRFEIRGAPASRKAPVEVKLNAYEMVGRGSPERPRTAVHTTRVEGAGPHDVGDIVLPRRPPAPPRAVVWVVAPDGRPFFGATVGAGGMGGGQRTDAQGRVEVPWPPLREGKERGPLHLIAQAQGPAPTPFTIAVPGEGSAGEAHVTLLPGHRVAGRVLRPDGTPAAQVQVWIADGTRPAEVVMPADTSAAFQQVHQPPRDGSRARIYAVATTDAEGRFAAQDVPAGPYHVRSFGTRRVAPPPGTPPLQVTLSDVASDTLDLVVPLPQDDSPATGGLLVRVLDAATREPVLDASLWARVDGRVVGSAGSRGVPGGPPPPPPMPGPPAGEPSGPGREPGTYRLTNLPVGRVTLEVQSAGRRIERVPDLEVVVDRITPTPDVHLVRGACVTGRVDLPKGQRADERRVVFVLEGAPDDAPQIMAPLAPDGSFSTCGFAPGRYAVRCLSQGFDPGALVLIPAAGSALTVPEGTETTAVEGPWIVAGTLALRPDDARLPPSPWDSERGTPERDRFGAGTRVTLTDAAGRVLLSIQPVRRHWLGSAGMLHLPPGSYTARIEFPEGETREESVVLEAGKQVDVLFRKKP